MTQYLVMKRASIEPNFHQLYLEFMESVELTNFAREVLKETYRNIKVCDITGSRALLVFGGPEHHGFEKTANH